MPSNTRRRLSKEDVNWDKLFCHEEKTSATKQPTKKVVIVGSGPAGLLTAIYILRRNSKKSAGQPRYQVTLVDREDDYTLLDKGNNCPEEKRDDCEESLKIGLTAFALDEIMTFPNLYEEYISKIRLQKRRSQLRTGEKSLMMLSLSEDERARSGFMVDKNAVCVALANYLDDMYGNPQTKVNGTKRRRSKTRSEFVTYYNKKAIFVNEDYKYVMIQDIHEKENPSSFKSLEYDLIIGCDGEKSFVRTMFEDMHDDFDFSLVKKVGVARSITLSHPKNTERSFMQLFDSMPNITTAIFPDDEGSDELHLTCGYEHDRPVDPELKSDDPTVVSAYFKKHFKAFRMDWDVVGREWVSKKWFATGMITCNYFHSKKMSALLLGDEASMTVPNIGNGMNRTMLDLALMNSLFDWHDDDIKKVLPDFSKARNRKVSPLKDWFVSL